MPTLEYTLDTASKLFLNTLRYVSVLKHLQEIAHATKSNNLSHQTIIKLQNARTVLFDVDARVVMVISWITDSAPPDCTDIRAHAQKQ